ncbi:hypothetical protein HPP92_004673 [Vanilla planifolia]|uniref:K-box domain-containing protein n=1 Tax=Vanilla planifolia TaxID=51239 RepID=A0A835RQS8_VANPL|nr:hypothetical protein HPP92_004673 [Vanilla planifolia]
MEDTSKTLERYQRCCYNSQATNAVDQETQSWYQEVSKLKAKFESLQRSHRHLLGEDLGPLNVKELQQLERQLESALAQARQRKTQMMLDQMEELRKKERQLGEINKQLKLKLEADGGSLKTFQGAWGSDAGFQDNSFQIHPSHSIAMECEPTLHIGYHQFVPPEAAMSRTAVGDNNNFMLGWVL